MFGVVHANEVGSKATECFDSCSDAEGVAYESLSVERTQQNATAGGYGENTFIILGVFARTELNQTFLERRGDLALG